MESAGGTIVAISPETAPTSAKLIADRKLQFPILRDEGNAYAAQFNTLNRLPDDVKAIYLNFGVDLEAHNGEPSWTLPVPGSYVIDRTGTIRHATASADYTQRPEPDESVAAMAALAAVGQ